MSNTIELKEVSSDWIGETVRIVCSSSNDWLPSSSSSWSFRAAQHTDFIEVFQRTKNGTDIPHFDRLFGIVATPTASDAKDGDRLLTFYFSYSTWDGRVLVLDFHNVVGSDPTKPPPLFFSFYQVLAKIAVELQCSRLVWGHYGDLPDFGATAPEVLHGWLTLHWQPSAAEAFLSQGQIAAPAAEPSSDSTATTTTDSSVAASFQRALDRMQHPTFSLRLATGSDADLDTIERLVMGLAVYEKEPESVHIGKTHYKVDGFGKFPLFHCVFVEQTGEGEAGTKHACGMAFCYVGCHFDAGPFLYLEDLFLDESARGKGGGSLVMRALALAAQSLGCTKVVWQALDWNTPALNFYNKIGARVQEGLITSRFAGPNLPAFANSISSPAPTS